MGDSVTVSAQAESSLCSLNVRAVSLVPPHLSPVSDGIPHCVSFLEIGTFIYLIKMMLLEQLFSRLFLKADKPHASPLEPVRHFQKVTWMWSLPALSRPIASHLLLYPGAQPSLFTYWLVLLSAFEKKKGSD